MTNKMKNGSKAFNEGLNHGLAANEKSRSVSDGKIQRAPLHNPDISGKSKNGFVPNRITYAKNRLEELKDILVRMIDERIARELEAGRFSKPLPWLVIILILVLFDGLLLGPVISNAIHSFNSVYLIFTVGIGVSLIIVAGGFSIGWATRSIMPNGYGKALSAIISAVAGAVVGFVIGWASDGTIEGILIRCTLTSLSMLVASVFHFIHAESSEYWGAVAVAKRQEQAFINERNSCLAEIDKYEETTIAEHEAFNHAEAERQEGFEVGKQGQRRWIRPDIKNMVVMILCLSLMMASCSSISQAEERSTTILIIDATDESNREDLATRVLAQAPLGYGQNIEAYFLGCSGLTQVYKNKTKAMNQPKHRQSLKAVKDELSKMLKEELQTFSDTACSPIATSLLMLSVEIVLRQKSGETISVVIGSDFEANRETAKIEGQPYEGVEVVVILTSTTGRNIKKRKQAFALIEQLFIGANLTITN